MGSAMALPLLITAGRARWSGTAKTAASLVVALILGLCTSTIAGEITQGLPDGLIAVLIDTSLAYTGSQVAYRLFWKPLVEARLRTSTIHPNHAMPPSERR